MDSNQHDVVVIGAGISGLLVALRLQAAGRSVAVLEARPRVGGRAYSPSIGGAPVDAGPSWVWDHETHVHRLIQELGLELYRPWTEGRDRYQRGGQTSTIQLPTSASPEARLVGGTAAIGEALAERVDGISLDTRVTAIARVDTGLEVRSDRGTHRAAAVVAALPPALLARTIDLPLDEATSGFLRQVPVWMGDIAKVVAVYDTPFWRKQGLSGRAASADGPMIEVHDHSGPADDPAALFGFVPRSLGGAELDERVRAQLGVLFGPEAEEPRELRIFRWWDEPTTFPEGLTNTAMQLLGQPALREPLLEGRLHLVSTETSGVSPGHIDGAVERAEAVAAALAAS